MIYITMSNNKNSPVQKLKANQDTPIEQFCIVVSETEIEELIDYVDDVAYDPSATYSKIKKVLLLYVAAVRFMILSFETDETLYNSELINKYENLAKSLYMFYKDLNIILITKEISSAWKAYVKLADMGLRAHENSQRKISSSRDRILLSLKQTSDRIKSL